MSEEDKLKKVEKLLNELYPNHQRLCSIYLKYVKKTYIAYIVSLDTTYARESLRKKTHHMFEINEDDNAITEATVVRRMLDSRLWQYYPKEKDDIVQFLLSFTDNEVIRLSGINADKLLAMFNNFKKVNKKPIIIKKGIKK